MTNEGFVEIVKSDPKQAQQIFVDLVANGQIELAQSLWFSVLEDTSTKRSVLSWVKDDVIINGETHFFGDVLKMAFGVFPIPIYIPAKNTSGGSND